MKFIVGNKMNYDPHHVIYEKKALIKTFILWTSWRLVVGKDC